MLYDITKYFSPIKLLYKYFYIPQTCYMFQIYFLVWIATCSLQPSENNQGTVMNSLIILWTSETPSEGTKFCDHMIGDHCSILCEIIAWLSLVIPGEGLCNNFKWTIITSPSIFVSNVSVISEVMLTFLWTYIWP